jgi:hypothetical protein
MNPLSYVLRRPNACELQQLANWLQSLGAYDEATATMTAENAYIAVYDEYCTGCPGYFGKLMSVVWDGSPSTYDVFIWSDDKMEQVERD